jgi:methionyl-tRNA formyltransferase
MRIVFCGSPAFAVPSLERLIATDHEIVCVVTQPDRPAGRGLSLTAPPVKQAAAAHGIAVHQPEKFNTKSFRAVLEGFAPDLVAVVAYGKIFRRKALDLPRFGCVNVHASLLPKYRGIAPVNWAIIKGETETGVTTILMDEGIDTGDILLSRSTSVGEDETAGELLSRLSVMGADVLAETCDLIAAGTACLIKQDHDKATHAPKLSKEDGQIVWERPAGEVHDRIRGVTPWPGARTFLKGSQIKVIRSGLAEAGGGEPGKIIDIDSENGILVSCGSGRVWLTTLQAQGRKAVSGADFARGQRIKAGDLFTHGT